MTPADLIEPAGELTQEMFPGKDIEEFVGAWLSEAQAKTAVAAAHRPWVHHRAFTHVANRLNLEAATETKGDASAQRLFSQMQYWRERAAAALEEYLLLTQPTTTTPGPILTRMRL